MYKLIDNHMKLFFLLFFVLGALMSSCTSSKQFAYLKDITDSTFEVQREKVEYPINTNDILDIRITSRSSAASAEFNINDNKFNGYLVDNFGNIQMPVLGSVSAAGLTKSQLKDNITNMILSRKLLLDPIVEIRYKNFEVTVLGEVLRPNVITVTNEDISLVKALGFAGDLTIYGKRENVLLIREESGKRIVKRIDLTSPDFINSPYYYLKPNDVIYIEPNKNRITASDKAWVIVPTVIGALSLLIISYGTFVK